MNNKNKRNQLHNMFKMNQALEVKNTLLLTSYREQQLIKEGMSDNYDQLEIVNRYITNLSHDMTQGMLYIKRYGEEPSKNTN